MVRRGTGQALLYLHGIDGLTRWPEGLGELESSFEIVAPSAPGFGNSSGLGHLEDVHDVAIFYQDLLDALHLKEVAVVGHSLGGMFAAELAAAAPSRVSKLILVAPFGLWLDESPVADLVGALRKNRIAMAWGNPAGAAALLAPPASDEEALERDLVETQHLISSGKFLWGVPDHGLRKRLHRITAKTLVVWGNDDAVMGPRYGEVFASRISGSELRVIPRCGHQVIDEQPLVFSRMATDFLHNR